MAVTITSSGLQSVENPSLPRQPKPEKDLVKEEQSKKLSCEAKGGTWDEEAQTCRIPEKIARQRSIDKAATGKDFEGRPIQDENILRDVAGGVTGFERGGKTFLGIKEEQLPQDALRTEGVQEAAATREQQAEIQAQQELLQTTEQPLRRELDPTLEAGESFPVFGPLVSQIRKNIPLISGYSNLLDLKTESDFFQLQPEELKTIALSQIEKNEIEKGLTDSEKFGSFVEALSLGDLSNFAAEKPSENVQTILKTIKTLKTRATNAEIKVKDGTWRQSYGEETIDEIEGKIQAAESRIKLLIQDSPEYKFNSDGVNFIETKILEARERLFAAKINMISGAAKDPSEIDILIALRESIQAEDFEV